MKHEFKLNGDVSLTLKPDNNALEGEFIKQLFAGEIIFERISSTNHPDEIVIKRKTISSVPVVSILSPTEGQIG